METQAARAQNKAKFAQVNEERKGGEVGEKGRHNRTNDDSKDVLLDHNK